MKKALILFLALAVLFALAGCGGNGEDLEEKVSGVVDNIEDGLNDLEDQLNDLDDKLNGTSDEEPETEATEAPTTEPEQAPSDGASPSDGDIRPEIKEAIDSYEAFFNEYADFMESYDASDISALTEYLSMLEQYTETEQKLDDMEDEDLTDAELQYYTQATLRIEQRLLEVTG